MVNFRSYLARLSGQVITILILLLLAAPHSADAQARNIKGKIMADSSNEPLAGVSVHAKGQRTATTTGPNGSFTLAIDGAVKTLVISYVGYETREVTIGSSDVLTVILKPGAAGNLGEVVVIGYGSLKRQDVTSAVSTVKPDDFNQNGARNVLDLIQGKVAGLTLHLLKPGIQVALVIDKPVRTFGGNP